MKNWFSEVDVTEMSRAFRHIASAGLAARVAVNDALSRVHETAQLRAARFHRFREADTALRNRHPSLKNLDLFHLIEYVFYFDSYNQIAGFWCFNLITIYYSLERHKYIS